jgi:hypothetical protein
VRASMAVVRSSAAWMRARVWAARSMRVSFCWIWGVSSHWAMAVTEILNMSAMSGRVKRVERTAERRAAGSVEGGRGWLEATSPCCNSGRLEAAPPWFSWVEGRLRVDPPCVEVGWGALTRGLVSGTGLFSVLFLAIIMECMMGDRRGIARGFV